MTLTIYHGHIDHRHGYDHHAATDYASFIAWAANYCREFWDEWFSEDKPGDLMPDSDEEIVEKYFEKASRELGGDGEYFHHDTTEVELPQPLASAATLLDAAKVALDALELDAKAIGAAMRAEDINWFDFGRATVRKQETAMPLLRRVIAQATEQPQEKSDAKTKRKSP